MTFSEADLRPLNNSIEGIVVLLESVDEKFWSTKLREASTALADKNKQALTLRQFKDYFGGMGSLNDIYLSDINKNLPTGFTAREANKKLSRLLDRCFKEYRLLGAPLPIRMLWRILEWKHRGEIAPRIKNAFRK